MKKVDHMIIHSYEIIIMNEVVSKVTRSPLYEQVKQQMIESFSGKKGGDRISTESEYVKLFGVSITTIRQAVRALESEGWLEKRQGSGTFLLDASFRRRKHVAVLLDVEITSANLSPYWLKIVREIQTALGDLGFAARPYFGDLPLGQEATGLTCQYLLDDIRMDRIQGVISFFTKRDPSWTDLLAKKNIPCIDPDSPQSRYLDRRTAEIFLHSSLSHLKERGRTLVSALLWESSIDGLHAFSNALLHLAPQYDMKVDPRLLDVTASGWERGMGWERFRDIWRCNKEKPDALIVADDGLFADCQKAILEMGVSVPNTLDVVVRSSDAVNLNPQFPIYDWKILTAAGARVFAECMKAEIEGVEFPSIQKWPFVASMSGPQEEGQAPLSSIYQFPS